MVIGDYPNKTKEKNDIPVYLKTFFKEMYKRNKMNVMVLDYYDGGIYVLLGNNRKEWLVSNTHTF